LFERAIKLYVGVREIKGEREIEKQTERDRERER
jgi:hypothetical protein